jgi:hypothetical protein
MRADNSAHIIAAARRRSDDARRRAVTALRRLDADGQPSPSAPSLSRSCGTQALGATADQPKPLPRTKITGNLS